MNERSQTVLNGYSGVDAGATSAVDRNKVLRNTYWLLALSLVPTVLGAWIGLTTGIMTSMGTGMSLAVFFIGAYGLMFAVEKTKNSSTGVVVLLAFTFFMGLMLSRLLAAVLGLSNGTTLVMTAFAGTAAVFFAMATLASVVKRDLSSMAKFLVIGMITAIVVSVINVLFLQSSALFMAISAIVILISSALMLYSVKSILDGGETNYISATLSLYVNIYNVFSNLLAMLGILGGERE